MILIAAAAARTAAGIYNICPAWRAGREDPRQSAASSAFVASGCTT
jgi:hypothetical protein